MLIIIEANGQTQTKCNVDVNPTIFLPAAALPNFWAKVKLEKSSHIWHHTRNSSRRVLYNYLFISIFWQKEVESRALTECKNMIFIIITIAESERWLSLLSLCKDSFDCKSGFFCIQFRASVWDFFFGCVDVKISSEFNLPILYDSVSLEYSLFLLLWMKLDVMIHCCMHWLKRSYTRLSLHSRDISRQVLMHREAF